MSKADMFPSPLPRAVRERGQRDPQPHTGVVEFLGLASVRPPDLRLGRTDREALAPFPLWNDAGVVGQIVLPGPKIGARAKHIRPGAHVDILSARNALTSAPTVVWGGFAKNASQWKSIIANILSS